jgi:hypothetical protein
MLGTLSLTDALSLPPPSVKFETVMRYRPIDRSVVATLSIPVAEIAPDEKSSRPLGHFAALIAAKSVTRRKDC